MSVDFKEAPDVEDVSDAGEERSDEDSEKQGGAGRSG